jgi:hypothetical protein
MRSYSSSCSVRSAWNSSASQRPIIGRGTSSPAARASCVSCFNSTDASFGRRDASRSIIRCTNATNHGGRSGRSSVSGRGSCVSTFINTSAVVPL